MKTLSRNPDKAEILSRIASLPSNRTPLWGKMSCPQMICHLNDSFLCAIGEIQASPGGLPLPRAIAKWGALYFPMPWPKGVPTRPEIEQGVGGTAPVDFEQDRQNLFALIERFSNPKRDFAWAAHPFFGPMTERDWLRWGYLHCDHHLRQFGA